MSKKIFSFFVNLIKVSSERKRYRSVSKRELFEKNKELHEIIAELKLDKDQRNFLELKRERNLRENLAIKYAERLKSAYGDLRSEIKKMKNIIDDLRSENHKMKNIIDDFENVKSNNPLCRSCSESIEIPDEKVNRGECDKITTSVSGVVAHAADDEISGLDDNVRVCTESDVGPLRSIFNEYFNASDEKAKKDLVKNNHKDVIEFFPDYIKGAGSRQKKSYVFSDEEEMFIIECRNKSKVRQNYWKEVHSYIKEYILNLPINEDKYSKMVIIRRKGLLYMSKSTLVNGVLSMTSNPVGLIDALDHFGFFLLKCWLENRENETEYVFIGFKKEFEGLNNKFLKSRTFQYGILRD